MEQVLERGTSTKIDWRNIEMYYDDGRRITNPDILMSIAEGQLIVEAWKRRMDSSSIEGVFGEYDEVNELDG